MSEAEAEPRSIRPARWSDELVVLLGPGLEPPVIRKPDEEISEYRPRVIAAWEASERARKG